MQNTGGGLLSYTLTSNASWISISGSSSGALAQGQVRTITLNISQLQSYVSRIGTVTISAPGAVGPKTITVSQQGLPIPISLNVNRGSQSGGTPVVVSGSNFDNGLQNVLFGSQPAQIQSSTATQISLLSPPGVGVVDVSVVKASGTETRPNAFTYEPPPNAISITPVSAGPTNASSVDFTVMFDKDVVNFEAATDIIVNRTSDVSYADALITGSGKDYTVTLTGITGEGAVILP